LNPNTTYYFAIYEYNNTDVCYLTPGLTGNELTLPAQPSAITGDATPCEGSSQTYSVTNVSGVSYAWTVPGDWTINSGQGTNSITVTVGTNNGNVQVTPSNASGNGTAQTLAVTVDPLPVAPTSVAASSNPICNGDNVTLSYSGGSGTTFGWYTSSCGGTSVGTGNNLSVSPSATTTYYGRWENSCGSTSCQSVTITVNDVPAQPSAITGPTNPTTGTNQTYSVTNVGGVTYTWTVPGDWSINSGQGTNSINVTVGSNSGNVTVTPSNSCGNGTAQNLAVNPVPAASAPTITNVSPNNFFADKGATLTITGSDLGDLTATVTLGGISGNVTSNNGSSLIVDFPAGHYTNSTLTVSTGVNPDATSTVTVNTRNIIPVGGGTDPHATIQSALNGLYAWFGTNAFSTNTTGYLSGTKTIDVYNGTYTDIVTPNVNLGTTAAENLIIKNATGQTPVINASGNANAFYIEALDYVQIIGFTAYNSTDAVIYTEGDNNLIQYNKCYGSTAGAGIILNNALSTTVINNLVFNNYTFGIRLIASNNAIIQNNTVANNANEAKAPPLPGLYVPAQLYVESGTGVEVENNIFYAKSGSNVFTLLTESGITVNSDYNTYYKNGNTNLVYYNGALYADIAAWTGNGAGTNDLEADPDFVTAGTDFHIHSTFDSYAGGSWPPNVAAGGTWTTDGTDSPALDTGNPADAFANEPASGGRINQGAYGNTAQASKSVACTYPTTQATVFTATPAATSINIGWTRGNGDAVIVLAHSGSAVDADPVDGTTYTANAVFGTGTQIGTGNYVVFDGAGTSVNVTGLTTGVTYYFAVYEYTSANTCFLIPALTGNSTTVAAAPSITSVTPNNFFADKGATLTITGSDLGDLTTTVTLGGISGTVTSNDGSTLVVDFLAGHYTNSTLTVSTGVNPDATSTVTVNTRNIIPVGGGTDFHATIQSALNGLYAWFGTNAFSTNTTGYLSGTKTIDVYNGTYTDIVTPNVNLGTTAAENLIIQNHTGESPVINATGNNYGVYIGALDYVQVTGFTIHTADIDLIYTEGDNNSITLNKCYGSTSGTGIMLNNAASATVINNLVYNNNQFGIRITGSNNVTVKNNTLANNGTEAKGPPLPGIYTPAQIYVESGTGTSIENNIFYAKSGTNVFTLLTETGITVSSDYNTYYKNGNTNLVYYNGTVYADIAAWTGNGAGANDIETDPDFVNASTDFHIKSTNDSYPFPNEWPPEAAAGVWNTDATTSPALDTGNPADAFANEPVSGGRINQGAYGNTAQASKSAGLYWDGSTDTNWQDITNWTPQQIPTATDDIIIPDGCPNYPIINVGAGTAVCNNMTIAANANVEIATDGEMTVSGSITNNRGAAGLIVKSDANGDGSLIANNAVEATVERFVTGDKWHLLFPTLSTIPTSTYTVEGTNTNNNFYSYNELTEDYWDATVIYETTGWTSEVASANIRTDKGYLFNRYNYGDKTFVQTGGNIEVADKVFDVSYTISSVVIGNGVTESRDYFDGWNLAGNPYTSAIDWDQVTLNGIENGIYYYDGNTSNYRYYMQGGDGSQPPAYNVGISLNGGSQYIPSGQGFMTKVINTGATHNTTFTIPATARIHDNQAFYKKLTEVPDLLRVQIDKNGFTDELIIRTLPQNVTIGHDSKYDVYKMFAWDNSKPQIYSLTTDFKTNFAINSLPEITESIIIPLGVYIGTAGEYTIRHTENNFESIDIYLHDIQLDKLTKLEGNASYTFSSEIGLFKNRFELLFEKSNSNIVNYTVNDIQIYPNPNNGSFWLTVDNKAKSYIIEIHNVAGQTIYENKFINSGTKEIKLDKTSAGIYFIKIIFDNKYTVNKKIIIQK